MTAKQPPRHIVRWSPQKTSGRKRGPQALITLHESVGMLDTLDLARYCEREQVSYHAIVDDDKIVYAVPYDDTAWHLRNGNPYADGLCMTSPVRGYTGMNG